jgi:hypothetical protein
VVVTSPKAGGPPSRLCSTCALCAAPLSCLLISTSCLCRDSPTTPCELLVRGEREVKGGALAFLHGSFCACRVGQAEPICYPYSSLPHAKHSPEDGEGDREPQPPEPPCGAPQSSRAHARQGPTLDASLALTGSFHTRLRAWRWCRDVVVSFPEPQCCASAADLGLLS